MAQISDPWNGGASAYEFQSTDTAGPAGGVAPGGLAGQGRTGGILGGIAALGLIAGLGYWGTELVMRDISEIPVVRAVSKEMRVAPNDPGGEISSHSGLSVNQVAAGLGVAASEDSLRLAPAETGLSPEDEAPAASMVEARADGAEAPGVVARAAHDDLPRLGQPGDALSDETLALVGDIMKDAMDSTDATAASAPGIATLSIIPASVPGVARAPRPLTRPAGLGARAASATAAPARLASADGSNAAIQAALTEASAAPAVQVSLATDLPKGTVLAQLGAYQTPEIAVQEWDRFLARIGPYLENKERVIQKADSGGRTYFRLRVKGFDDLGGARRFCAGVTAEGAECIPVTLK